MRVCVISACGALGFCSVALPAHAEEIVVTGERRPAAALETAASIGAIDAEEIDRVGADHPAEALNRIAGVLIQRGSGQEHLTAIRSPVLTGGAGAGSFLFLENGVPLRPAGFANVNGLFEAHSEIADRIEVQRGPSGAVYGANAIHGVVNVITPAPDRDRIMLELSGDTIGRIKSRGIASHANANGGLLGAYSALDDPGFRAASGADEQKLTLRVDHEAGKIRTRTIFSAVNLEQETAGFVEGPDSYRDATLRRSNPNPEAFRDAKALRISTAVEIDAGEGVTVHATPYARWSDMDFLLHFLPSKALEENGFWSVGAQSAVYADGPGDIDYFGGVDVDYSSGFLREFQSIPDVFSYVQGLHYDYDVSSVSVSPFAGVDWRAGDRLTLSVAGRVDWTRYAYDNQANDGVTGRFLRPSDRKDAFLTVSPKASARYALDRGLIYASYARGARPPQTSDLYRLQINQTENAARPETIDALEAGFKGALADTITVEIAGYFMRKRNFYFRDADGFNVPDGRTRHLGAEAAVEAALGHGFTLAADVSYGAHTYRFDRPVLSLPQASEAISFGADVDTAPRILSNARLGWSDEGGRFGAEIEWMLVGRYFADAANTARYDGHNVMNIRGQARLSRRLFFFATLRNVANNFYADRADFAFGSDRYFPGEGRVATIGLRLDRDDRD